MEALGRRFDPMDVGVARAFYVAKDADDKRKAVEARLANQRRMTELAAAPGAVKSSMLSFDYTLDAAEESAMYGTPDEIAAKLDTASRGRHRACAAQRRGRGGREPAPLRARGDAGVFGREARRGGVKRCARRRLRSCSLRSRAAAHAQSRSEPPCRTLADCDALIRTSPRSRPMSGADLHLMQRRGLDDLQKAIADFSAAIAIDGARSSRCMAAAWRG